VVGGDALDGVGAASGAGRDERTVVYMNMHEPGGDDPVTDIWSQLFSGDADTRFQFTTDGVRCRALELRSDGGEQTVTVRFGNSEQQMTIPTREVNEIVGVAADAVADAAAALTQHAEAHGRSTLGVGGLRAHVERDVVAVGQFADLLARGGSGTVLGNIARGEDISCSCTDPTSCRHCAGTGRRRTRGTIRVVSADGGRTAMMIDAAAVGVADVRETFSYPDTDLPQHTRTRRCLDLAPLADLLQSDSGTGGWVFEIGRTMVLIPDRVHGWADQLDTAGLAQLSGTLLRFVPSAFAPVDPDEPGDEVVFDNNGRVAGYTVAARAARGATGAWAELSALTGNLARPDGWTVETVLHTSFIATGQYGPAVAVLARPVDDPHRRRAVRIASVEAGSGLERTLETAALRLRHANLDVVTLAVGGH
jgi:hypothetical protein